MENTIRMKTPYGMNRSAPPDTPATHGLMRASAAYELMSVNGGCRADDTQSVLHLKYWNSGSNGGKVLNGAEPAVSLRESSL
jgi:hypothetical protein